MTGGLSSAQGTYRDRRIEVGPGHELLERIHRHELDAAAKADGEDKAMALEVGSVSSVRTMRQAVE